MPPIQVAPDIHWIGVNDRTTDLFEGMWPITQEGVSYNAYLVLGAQTALIDLVKGAHAGALLDQIAGLIDPAVLDYVIVNHMEPDHTGAINLLTRVAPKVTFVASAKAAPMLEAYYGLSGDRIRTVKDGDTLSLGGTTLCFHMIPFVHWPETMVTYAVEQKVVFSCDAFGGFGALRGAVFDDGVTDMDWYLREALRYYANIVAKFSRPVLQAIDKLSRLDVEVIAPSHGLIWRRDPRRIVDLYRRWAEYAQEPGEPGVTLIYGSMYGMTEEMMNAVAEGISSVGVPLAIFDAARTHTSYILPHLWTHSGVMIGAPTYEAGVFPPVAAALQLIAEKRVMLKSVARFGSYTWSGGAQRAVENLVAPLKWEWFDSYEFLGAPTQEDLQRGEDLGRRFARSLI